MTYKDDPVDGVTGSSDFAAVAKAHSASAAKLELLAAQCRGDDQANLLGRAAMERSFAATAAARANEASD